jgi:hypothetical protein
MNKLLPYEEDVIKHLKDIPLPDENMAWADMAKRLDDDKDTRPVASFPFHLWSVLGILTIAFVAVFVLYKNIWADKNPVAQTKSSTPAEITDKKQTVKPVDEQQATENSSLSKKDADSTVASAEPVPGSNNDITDGKAVASGKENQIPDKQINKLPGDADGNDKNSDRNNISTLKPKNEPDSKPVFVSAEKTEAENINNLSVLNKLKKKNGLLKLNQLPEKKPAGNNSVTDAISLNPSANYADTDITSTGKSNKPESTVKAGNKKNVPGETNVSIIAPGLDSSGNTPSKNIEDSKLNKNDVATTNALPKDSNTLRQADTTSVAVINKQDSVIKSKAVKKNKAASKGFSFAAGTALWQSLDNIGPKANAILYPQAIDSSGNQIGSSKLLEYIPSIYARLYKGEKWFLQAEFKYRTAVSEYDKLYSKVITTRNSVEDIITLKVFSKAYYFQVPLTVNYFVAPNWSLGTGIVWNKFSKGTGREIISLFNTLTNKDSVTSIKGITINNADNSFKSSWFQLRFETQYRWKRFSMGLNYSMALQPYLQFTLPNNSIQKEKNNSLQLFIRYEFLKPKK